MHYEFTCTAFTGHQDRLKQLERLGDGSDAGLVRSPCFITYASDMGNGLGKNKQLWLEPTAIE